jgi:hypothetical protein
MLVPVGPTWTGTERGWTQSRAQGRIPFVSVSQTTKLRWFDRGAAAFERTFPGLIASRFGANVGPVYVCPLCDRAFARETVSAGVLTAEHVPPVSFGGRELLLTCKPCNSEAGSRLDAEARKKENLSDVMRGTLGKPRKVRVRHREQKVNARLVVSSTGWALNVGKRNNDPAALAAFKAAGPPVTGSPVNVEFVGDRFAELGAKMSWFRSGFLALFAAFGYRFSCDPALRIVKRQLASPDARLIYSFTIEIRDQGLPWSEWKILEIPDPRCTGVVFGRYVIVFPHRGDVTFYEQLEAHVRAREGSTPATVTAPSFELADGEPLFGYDIEDLKVG